MEQIKNVQAGKVAKRNAIPMMWQVLSRAQKVYEVQLNKGGDVKLNCLMRFMPAKYNDTKVFWREYAEQINLLIDSRKFCRACAERDLDPKIVAENIVFYGSAAIRKVIREGLEKFVGGGVDEFRTRFTPVDIDPFVEGVDNYMTIQREDSESDNMEAVNIEVKPQQLAG